MSHLERYLENSATSINFEFPAEKIEAAVKKILDDCRSQNFTVREFSLLLGELNLELENSHNRAEINSIF